MLPSETMIWQPEFTDKTLSRKPGAVHPDANDGWIIPGASWKPSHWMPLPEPPL
ncbi:DUF551 domain-containing protein [Escherichia coli]|uniref:DUF551 domain-containing protein n=1 Tax=Escherichia coli TaxID=562 RepID=UPI0008FEE564|nr:DUF551 domain-containing protein [Escherichia coli]